MLYGAELARIGLSGEAGKIAFRVGLLSPAFEAVARAHAPGDRTRGFPDRAGDGEDAGVMPPDRMGRAIAPAFLAPQPSETAQALVDGDRLGEAILTAIDEIAGGVQGDPWASRGAVALAHGAAGRHGAKDGAGADASGTAGLRCPPRFRTSSRALASGKGCHRRTSRDDSRGQYGGFQKAGSRGIRPRMDAG